MSLSILGTGSALPEQAVDNHRLAAFLNTSDEWVSTRTGIRSRHVMDDGESVTTLAVAAARRAMENAGVAPGAITHLLCATIGGEYITPSLACMVQGGIGAACPAMDLNAACAGFVYGLEVAAALLCQKPGEVILLVGAEGLSRVVDWTDRSVSVLFGDGAGAVVLGAGGGLRHLHLTSECRPEVLYMRFPPGNWPHRAAPEGDGYLHMDGQEVYKFAVNAIVENVQTALAAAGLAPHEVTHMLLHQANLRIIEAAQKRLPIPAGRYAVNIGQVGNLSAASIPVLLDGLNRAGRLNDGDILVMSGFGAGLTTGTAVLRWGRG